MARSTTLPQRNVIEAQGLVLAADGMPTLRVARQLGVSPDRVRRWRARFEREGVGGIGRVAPGRGRKPWLPAGTVAEIVRVAPALDPDGLTPHRAVWPQRGVLMGRPLKYSPEFREEAVRLYREGDESIGATAAAGVASKVPRAL